MLVILISILTIAGGIIAIATPLSKLFHKIINAIKLKTKNKVVVIPIDLSNKAIDLDDDALIEILAKAKRDILLGKTVKILLRDNELRSTRKKINRWTPEQQAELADYLDSRRELIERIEASFDLLLSPIFLKNYSGYVNSGKDLCQIARQFFQITGVNGDKSKVDVWREESPRISFGIHLTAAQIQSSLKSLDVPVFFRGFSAIDLPLDIVIELAIPGLLFELANIKLAPEDLSRAIMIHSYSIGPG